MTAVNQILPFATGSGANVLTAAQYQALAELGPGFTSGILPSANLNTVLRQASFVAAMIGQFIVDQSGNSALDDGNIAELEGNFTLALRSYLTLYSAYEADTGAANAYVVAMPVPVTSYTNGMQVRFRAAHANTGASTLNAGAGAVALVRDDGTPMQSGDIGANVVLTCTYDLTANAFLVNSIVSSQIQTVINSVVAAIQDGAYIYAPDTGTANAYAAAYSPAIAALVDGMVLEFGAAYANTGASTFSPNGLTAYPILGSAHQPLQGGEIIEGSKVEVMWDAALTSWVLLESTGGNIQTPTATQPLHAVNLAQAQLLAASASSSASNALYQLGYLL